MDRIELYTEFYQVLISNGINFYQDIVNDPSSKVQMNITNTLNVAMQKIRDLEQFKEFLNYSINDMSNEFWYIATLYLIKTFESTPGLKRYATKYFPKDWSSISACKRGIVYEYLINNEIDFHFLSDEDIRNLIRKEKINSLYNTN
jgi:hypothetical protein